MNKTLQIGLPVMIHYEEEVIAFLAAKDRLESMGDKIGMPMEVSAFLYYMPKALTPDNRAKQIENQRKYRLPIIHTQTPIQREHGIVTDHEENRAFGKEGLLEATIEQVAKLREYDPKGKPVGVDTHVGLLVFDPIESAHPMPGVYSVEEFMKNRDKLYKKCIEKFQELKAYSQGYGMDFLLENMNTVTVEPDTADPERKPRMHYVPFSGIPAILGISGKGNMTLDIAHWAGAYHVQKKFEQNNAIQETETLHKLEDVKDWNGYRIANPHYSKHMDDVKVLHLSNTGGIGVKLNKHPELAAKWGDYGTNEGLLSKDDFRFLLQHAQQKDIPVMIEVDYDVKNIPVNQFNEADTFLKYVME